MGFFLKKSGIINFEIYLSLEKYRFKYSTDLKINANNWNKETQSLNFKEEIKAK